MYEKAQAEQAAGANGAPSGAAGDGTADGAASEEDVVDAEVVDEGRS